MRGLRGAAPARGQRAILVGDLNVAPLEHDVWSHKQMLKRRLAHADRMREARPPRSSAGDWIDAMRVLAPEPEKLYTWWSYRAPDLGRRRPGRRLDHIWVVARARRPRRRRSTIAKDARGWRAAVRPRAGDGDARGRSSLRGARRLGRLQTASAPSHRCASSHVCRLAHRLRRAPR